MQAALTASPTPEQQVPPSVLAAIIEQAEASHPGDYSTQAYVIKTQVQAYIAISLLKSLNRGAQ